MGMAMVNKMREIHCCNWTINKHMVIRQACPVDKTAEDISYME